MGTFLAILLGTLAAGLLAADGRLSAIAAALIGVAVRRVSAPAWRFRALRPAAPDLRVDWRPWTSTWDNIRAARESRAVFLSILGISWFWFYGALVLAAVAAVLEGRARRQRAGRDDAARRVLGGHRHRVAAVRAALRPQGRDRPGAVRLDRPHRCSRSICTSQSRTPRRRALTAAQFVALPGSWRVLLDLGLIGVFGGFFIVPLYALVQQRSRREVDVARDRRATTSSTPSSWSLPRCSRPWR